MNRMIKLLAALSVLGATSAHAATVTLTPSQSTTLGNTVVISLVVSGLGDAGVSLGTFDLDVQFDAGVLSFDSATFGSGLDVLSLGSLQQVDSSLAGVVNLFELSIDSIEDLNTLQLDAFTLFTLTFNTVGVGTSIVGISPNAFGDAFGVALAVDPILQTSVDVAPVPLPAAAWLLMSGLGLLAGAGRRRGLWSAGTAQRLR
ncbi:MAG: hypothetical protein H7Y89_01685 [Steroidobacteraceae bacterium]|nr:hypothetical protein [Steroidobacteraceae bacterium]